MKYTVRHILTNSQIEFTGNKPEQLTFEHKLRDDTPAGDYIGCYELQTTTER